MGKKIDELLYAEVIAVYKKTGSLSAASQSVNINYHTARRILITAGIWASERSKQIEKLRNAGKGINEIAKLLNMSVKSIYNYSPLSDSEIHGLTPSKRGDMKNIYEYKGGYMVLAYVDKSEGYLGFFDDLKKAKAVRDESLMAKADGKLSEWYEDYRKKHL